MSVKIQSKLDSKYLDRFKRLESMLGERAQLTGAKLLIEQIKMEELKTEGGLIIPTRDEGFVRSSTTQGLTHIGLVLLTGEDATLPSGRPVKVGDIVWVGEMGVRPCTSFPGMLEKTDETLQLTSTDNIIMVFDSFAAYQDTLEALNGSGGPKDMDGAPFKFGRSQAI